MKRFLIHMGIGLASWLILAPANGIAGEITPGLLAEMQNVSPNEEIAVIVEMQDKVQQSLYERMERRQQRMKLVQAMRERANRDQQSIRSLALSQGGRKLRNLWIINGMAIKARPSLIQKLARQKNVKEVRQDLPVPLIQDTVSVTAANPWNLSLVGADVLWADGYGGQGVVIASMDSGVDYNHTQLNGNWRGGTNSWFDPHGEHLLPYDANGHGTQTAGIMVGQNLGGASMGMAPLAQWIAVKIFDDAGNAYTSNVHEGFQWLLDPDNDPSTDDAPDIINNSWGYPETENSCDLEFRSDFNTLANLGISVVFSAGNQGGSASSISPANNPGIFSVGAVDANSILASFSSQGPSACRTRDVFPTAVAPGVLVNTADLTFGGLIPDATMLATGTSFAAPHVSGAMALLLSVNPDLTPTELMDLLSQTGVDLGDAGTDYAYGNGLINVADAYSLVTPAEPPVDPPPDPDPDPDPNPDPPLDQCVDADGDGYFAQVTCGTPVDCNDSDPGIYPGAQETGFDSIDQDCNGFDLTIEITSAQYTTRRDTLAVQATSDLGSAADLQLEIPGLDIVQLRWNSRRQYWLTTVRSVSGSGTTPDSSTVITVFGPEGSVSQNITVR